MKNLRILLSLTWDSIIALWPRWTSPHKFVCAWCKKSLGGNKRATTVSHGICFGCAYKIMAVHS